MYKYLQQRRIASPKFSGAKKIGGGANFGEQGYFVWHTASQSTNARHAKNLGATEYACDLQAYI